MNSVLARLAIGACANALMKRAVRTWDVFKAKLEGHLAKRTQRLGADILKHLVDKGMEERAVESSRTFIRASSSFDGTDKQSESFIQSLNQSGRHSSKSTAALICINDPILKSH